MPVLDWNDWARHDATALAGLVRAGQVTAGELAEQAAEGVRRLNPRLNGVIELFADTLQNPGRDGPSDHGVLCGVPMFLKDLGSGLGGRRQES